METTWNPLTGCTRISPGCQHCYAERLARHLQSLGAPKYDRGFELVLHENALELPLRWKKPRRIFVNSMADLFHKDVPETFILRVFDVMRRASWHRFAALTKRSERLREMSPRLSWPSNVWMGVSVENAAYRYRIDDLRATGAAVKFLSLEPLLGPVPAMDLKGIDWVMVGGESGPGARPMQRDWVLEIRDQCKSANVPFTFHQWGGEHRTETGRLLDGRIYNEKPPAARDPQLTLF